MTKEQLEHYIKGGKFRATYSPEDTYDLNESNFRYIDMKIIVWQNILSAPICTERWKNQFRFSSNEIDGWFPEEDISNLEIIDDYIEHPEAMPRYIYVMEFLDDESVYENFGKGYSAPITVVRDYNEERDEFVVKELPDPPANKVMKAVWNGELPEESKWEVIYERD